MSGGNVKIEAEAEAEAESETEAKSKAKAKTKATAQPRASGDSVAGPGGRITHIVSRLLRPGSTPLPPTALPGPPGASDIEDWLVDRLAVLMELGRDEIDVRIPIERFGLDSRSTVGMTGELEDWLGIELPATLLWDYPTIAEASAYLAEESRLVQRSKVVPSSE